MLTAWLRHRLPSHGSYDLFFLLGLNQIPKVLHLLMIKLVDVGVCQLPLMRPHSISPLDPSNLGHKHSLILLTALAVIKLILLH